MVAADAPAQPVVICYTRHAEEKIADRKLDRAWVEAAITQPDRTEPDPNDPALTRSYLAIPALGGRVLRVVHRQEGDDIVVVTVHFDRGAKP